MAVCVTVSLHCIFFYNCSEPRPEDERVLCAIEADSNGVVSIRPDLSKGRKPYTIGSSGLGRDVFEYSIEHASNDISSDYCEQEQKMYRELYQRHNSLLATFIGKEFETVERNVLRVMLFGEIESARNFEYDNLYLHFFVDLPRGWSVPPSQELSWVTQTCQTKVEGKENVAYYSFPFDLELFYQLEQMQTDADEKLPSLPILYIEVLSMDSWHRYRTEGYTHYVIPSQTGVHKETLNCWRPTGVSVLAELRRFFIGGSPELEDPTYTGVPSTFQGNHLSKFGFRTETTGTVNLRLNVMMQSKALSDQKASSKASSNIMQSLGLNTLQSNVMQVLVALRNAQRRMRLAKEKAIVMRDYQSENTEA
ncbi:Meckel syndrome type 1 protein homolog [Octopus sinensis]|uniref:Meckel syndrome type 1 protein homolog n=1 Tax=Octopus sinensis TaxID=2607531 RepID=A0A7E6EIF6_9MOLL|nr:Meckel syndrome type 1 protein homolog [Octopus sinensis]